MPLKMSSAKWRPFCLGLNVLTHCGSLMPARIIYIFVIISTLRFEQNAILQTFSNASSWMNTFEFQIKFCQYFAQGVIASKSTLVLLFQGANLTHCGLMVPYGCFSELAHHWFTPGWVNPNPYYILTHCGLVTSYGAIELGQLWLR